jgi:hypothetical protein
VTTLESFKSACIELAGKRPEKFRYSEHKDWWNLSYWDANGELVHVGFYKPIVQDDLDSLAAVLGRRFTVDAAFNYLEEFVGFVVNVFTMDWKQVNSFALSESEKNPASIAAVTEIIRRVLKENP